MKKVLVEQLLTSLVLNNLEVLTNLVDKYPKLFTSIVVNNPELIFSLLINNPEILTSLVVNVKSHLLAVCTTRSQNVVENQTNSAAPLDPGRPWMAWMEEDMLSSLPRIEILGEALI